MRQVWEAHRIAAAAAQTNEPARQGLVTMTGTFIDTIIVCTMTGLCIVLTGSHTAGLEGVALPPAHSRWDFRYRHSFPHFF